LEMAPFSRKHLHNDGRSKKAKISLRLTNLG
jgi:hypothetical protein